MLLRFSKLLVVLTLTFSLGLHWTFLQSVAWLGMVVSYSQNATLNEALTKTFDGKHPCKLCKAVQEGKQTEKKQEVLKVETKLEFCLASKKLLLFPPTVFTLLSVATDSALSRNESPPTPPPRGFRV